MKTPIVLRLVGMSIACFALVSCGADNAAGPSGTGTLSFSTDARSGFSSIDLVVDGNAAGTLRTSVDATAPSCSGSNRVSVSVSAGTSHTYSARSDTGTTWSNYAMTVSSNQCVELRLRCTGGVCAPGASAAGVAINP